MSLEIDGMVIATARERTSGLAAAEKTVNPQAGSRRPAG